MNLAVRTLRDGRLDGSAGAPLLVLRDELSVVGGPALLRQAICELSAAIAGGRAQAAALTVVALERPATLYAQLCSLATACVTVLDCFSDPHGWGSIMGSGASEGSSSGGSPSTVVPLPGILAAPDGLQQLRKQLCGGSGSPAPSGLQQCVVFDSLSPLLDRFGPCPVAQLLAGLQSSPAISSLLAGLHSDLHPPTHVAAIEQLGAGALQLAAASELEQSVYSAAHGAAGEPQGRLTVRLKRAGGRARVESALYCIGSSGTPAFMEPPVDVLNPQAAAEKALQAAGASAAPAAVVGLAQQLAGGMRLELSASELEAKQRVHLPFEHQGQGAAYQTRDFRDYLPPEAGGRARPPSASSPAAPLAADGTAAGGGQQAQQAQQGQLQRRLGTIHYVRDSGSEHDSDEDPDDDLDI